MKNNFNLPQYNADIAVIGGGAAGCIAAGTAASAGKSVILLEKNSKIGRKIMISGKGRCNVTNNTELNGLVKNTLRNGKFLYSAFSRFGADSAIRFFEDLGVELKTERGNRVFPVSDKSADIVDALKKFLKNNNVKIITGEAFEIKISGDKKVIGLKNGDFISANSVIIATGGLSYPGTGSTGDGYEFAKKLGHKVIPLEPSLVPIIVRENWCRELQGLSLRNIGLSVVDIKKEKIVYNTQGELLFTHFGVSGPLILSAGAHMTDMESGKYVLEIDMKPALSFEQLDARILKDFSMNVNSDFINSLSKLLPRSMIPVVAKMSKIPFDLKVHQVTREMRNTLCGLLKKLVLSVESFAPIEQAVITRGGISVSEINPKTMESKLADGIYFAGEIIDVDAYTGGFNLQIAWSTGYAAGASAGEKC